MAEKKERKSCKGLNARHEAFLIEYLRNGENAKKAYKSVYNCSEKTADANSIRLLGNARIKARLSKIHAKAQEKTEITAEKIARELALIGFAKIDDYVDVTSDGIVEIKPFEKIPKSALRAIKKVKQKEKIIGSGEGGKEIVCERQVEYELYDKLEALKTLGKKNDIAMFTEKIQAEIEGGLNIVMHLDLPGETK
jgi:phage terminase small subunit